MVSYSLFVSSSHALPNLEKSENMHGVILYPDHIQKQKYYYLPAKLKLAKEQGEPLFSYNIFRYLGSQKTKTAGEYRVRGILSFEISNKSIRESLARIKSSLSNRSSRIDLVPMPVEKFASTLQYVVIAPNKLNNIEGEVKGGTSKETDDSKSQQDEGAWQSRRFMIGLNPLTANLFWDNFNTGHLQLSLSYHWKFKGVLPNKKGEESEKIVTKVFGDTLPLNVTMGEHPKLFSKIESWGNTHAAHTQLTVICYDFINEEISELYKLTVEIKLKNLRGHEYLEKVKFSKNDFNYEKQVNFRLAMQLDGAYEYRVTRLFSNGKKIKSQWKKHKDGFLDVSTNSYFE